MIVSNSGPVMALGKLGLLDLFQHLFRQVVLPGMVYDEVVNQQLKIERTDIMQVRLAIHRGYLLVKNVYRKNPEIESLPLDPGEKEVLQFTCENEVELVLMDDMLARKYAKSYGLSVTGTIGVIVRAYRNKLLSLDELKIIFDSIISRNDIWIAEGLCRRIVMELEDE